MEIEILNAIQTIRTPLLDSIMCFFTFLGDKGLIWILLAIIMLIMPKTRKTGIVMVAALLLSVLICSGILKPIVARPRPFDVNTSIQLLISAPTDYSFPSGHTSASFAVVIVLFLKKQKKLGIVTLILACCIAFSRMYLYVHYPTDILSGLVIGCFCGWAGNKIVQIIQKKKKDSLQAE